MNEIYEYLLLIAILSIAALWTTAMFCFFICLFGDYEDNAKTKK